MNPLRILGLASVFLWHMGCASVPPAPVAPQRAAFSSDPSTTAKRTIEVEAGLFVAENHARDVPVAIKWGASATTELFVGWSPYVRLAVRDVATSGSGDLVIGSRVRFMEETPKIPAAAIELIAKLPAADVDNEIGTGLVDIFVSGAVSKHLRAGMLVGFYQIGVLSNHGPGGTIFEHTVSSAFSRKLHGPLQGYAEMAGVFTPQQHLEALLIGLGLGYELNPRWILDLETFAGLTNDASPLAIAVGVTTNLGSLF
jgi:hypothetical protein